MKIVRLGRSVLLIAAAIAMLWASSATAQVVVPLSGAWGNNRGPLIDFPAIGNTPCSSLLLNRAFGTATTTPVPTTPPIPATDVNGVMNPQVGNPGGCVGAASGAVATVATGGAPQAFTVGTNVFSQPFPAGTNVVQGPVSNVATVATRNQFLGPSAAPFSPLVPTMGGTNLAGWRKFRSGAWTAQSGRAGSNFTWCFGNPGCAKVTQVPATGGRPLITKYTAGGNAFGGTMGLVLSALPGGFISVLNPPLLPGRAMIVPLPTTPGSLPEGRGYAVTVSNVLPGGMVYSTYTLTPTSGFIGMLGNFLATLPGGTNVGFGFPWTTGTVLVRNTGRTPLGMLAQATLSAMGGDNRTPNGLQGNITLVAGSLSSYSGNDTPNLNMMRLTFLPEPGATLQLVSGVLGLFGLHAFWRSRRRNG
jgi:hypothetical protein